MAKHMTESLGRKADSDQSGRFGRLLRFAEIFLLCVVPVALIICAALQIDLSALLTLVVVFVALAVFLVGYEFSRPALRQILPTVVLAALAVAGRILFFAVPNFKPVLAICIVAGVMFGRRSGFMVGALAALISNFFFGQGAWTPWQMYTWGLIGYVAGVLAHYGWFGRTAEDGIFRPRRVCLCVYGFVMAFFSGFILNTWTFVGFIRPLTWQSALLTYGAGLPFDAVQAVATVVFLLVIYVPWCRKLERIKIKYALIGEG